MTHLPAWDIRVALEQFPNSKESFIPEAMWEVVHEAVVGQCDGLDGVLDGLVSDPTRYVVLSSFALEILIILKFEDV